MTQEELAQRVGVTRQTIIALEARRYVPSLTLAMRVARVFGRTGTGRTGTTARAGRPPPSL